MKNLTLVVLGFAWVTLVSCHKDDDQPTGEYSSGIFVVNEGNFGASNGEISFYSESSNTAKQDIFFTKNNTLLGEVIQSMTIDGDQAYIVANNSDKMEIVNANTFALEHTVANLSLPRYFTVFGGKGYVTEWVSFTDPGRVSVIDLQNQSIVGTIPADFGTENIQAVNNELFVSNNFSNTVLVIDPAQNAVTDTVVVGSAPGAFVVDKNSRLWVICGGGYDMSGPLNDGALYLVNPATHEVERSIPLGQNLAVKLAINKAGDIIYFLDNTHVYAVAITDTAPPPSAFVTEPAAVGFYGIGVDPETDILYVGDASGFISSGTVFRYDAAGTKINSFTSGIGPNGFVFK